MSHLTLLLAQGDGAANEPITRQISGVFSSVVAHLDILNHPDQLLALRGDVHYVLAGVLLVVGILCIINGYRWHRWVIITCSFMLGFGLGWMLSRRMEQPYVVAAALALMAAVIANPLLRVSVAFFGGLTGAFVGANVWTALGYPTEMTWAGAGMGLILFAMASFMMFRHVVVLFTSIGGSAMAVCGAIALMLWVPEWKEGATRALSNNQVLVPLLITVAAVIGFVLQEGQKHEVEAEGAD